MKRTCDSYRVLTLRPEVEAALAEMVGDEPTYAVCRTPDGQAWEVNIRQDNIYSVLDVCYLNHDEAMAAGTAWLLAQRERETAIRNTLGAGAGDR